MLLGVLECHGKCLFTGRRGLEHGVIEYPFTDASQATRSEFVLDGGIDYEVLHAFFYLQFDAVHLEHFLVLLQYGILRLCKNTKKRILVQTVQVSDNRRP